MAEIRHQIAIEAPPEKVYAALATQAGLRSWWTADTVADHKTGGKAEFGFAQYRVKPSGVDKVKRAIAEFVPYVRANAPAPNFIRHGSRRTIRRALCIFSFLKTR